MTRALYRRNAAGTGWDARGKWSGIVGGSGQADPTGRGLPTKFYTDFRDGYLPDVFEPRGGGKPVGSGGNAYLQQDGSCNPYNRELQWMRPDNVRIAPSIYSAAEGNVLALTTRGDGYTTTYAANRTDPVFDYLVTHQNPAAGRDAEGNPQFPYTGGHVATQSDRLTQGRPLVVDCAKEWSATARMRWVNLPGYWPAFWMMPDPTSVGWVTERDIMEDFGTAAPNGGLQDANIVFANLFNNGSQLPYNNHKRRSLDLSQYHTWVVHNEPTGSQYPGQTGRARFRVFVDGQTFFDTDFYRQFSDINVDAFLHPISMHFIFQGAQIGGTGSNGGRLESDPYWRDLGPQATAALPITMEVSFFGVWEAGAAQVPSVPVSGHPTTAPLGT